MDVVAPRATERDVRGGKENTLRDFVRFSWRATRGLTNLAETEGRELVRRMTDMGRLTPEEGERLLKSLEVRMRRSRETFERKVEVSVRHAVERLQEISSRELSTLAAQATRLEERLEALLDRKRSM